MRDKWDMDEAYPPIFWMDYTPLVRKLTAEWMRCADLRCDDEYALNDLADQVGDMVVQVLKNRGMTRMLRMDREHIKKEDERCRFQIHSTQAWPAAMTSGSLKGFWLLPQAYLGR